jgi:antitoxin (DNA-binding transcriptional repressor) of toxin-antitoxin stability system
LFACAQVLFRGSETSSRDGMESIPPGKTNTAKKVRGYRYICTKGARNCRTTRLPDTQYTFVSLCLCGASFLCSLAFERPRAFRQRLVASDLRADRSSKGSVDVLRFVKHSISQMKTASVRELRQNFGSLMAWIEEGEEIQITMHRRVVARLVPEQPKSRAKVKMPDFAARLKRIHGGKVISAESAEAILDRNKGRY